VTCCLCQQCRVGPRRGDGITPGPFHRPALRTGRACSTHPAAHPRWSHRVRRWSFGCRASSAPAGRCGRPQRTAMTVHVSPSGFCAAIAARLLLPSNTRGPVRRNAHPCRLVRRCDKVELDDRAGIIWCSAVRASVRRCPAVGHAISQRSTSARTRTRKPLRSGRNVASIRPNGRGKPSQLSSGLAKEVNQWRSGVYVLLSDGRL
jgi:hypothetical protein